MPIGTITLKPDTAKRRAIAEAILAKLLAGEDVEVDDADVLDHLLDLLERRGVETKLFREGMPTITSKLAFQIRSQMGFYLMPGERWAWLQPKPKP